MVAGQAREECPLFPASAVFNQRIDDSRRFPAHPRSAAWLAAVGAARALHPDWGRSEDARQHETYYGIPYNVVDAASVRWLPMSYDISDVRETVGRAIGVPEESDCAVPDAKSPAGMRIRNGCDAVPLENRRFPFPAAAALKAEHGACNDPRACGDRHILVLERDACRLWESYFAYEVQGQWKAYSTAAWDLRSNAIRPAGWTSTDAAGLPVLPLLARADEAARGEVAHALRVTFRGGVMARRFVWPASHAAGFGRPDGIPFGAALRLRADFAIPRWWTTQARALARAMQTHGLYVADIGSDFFVQGEPSERWSLLTMMQLRTLRLEAFEFVDLGTLANDPRFRATSYQAVW